MCISKKTGYILIYIYVYIYIYIYVCVFLKKLDLLEKQQVDM